LRCGEAASKIVFRLGHREDLPSAKMPDAEAWFRTQKAIQGEGWKSKAPDLYRNKLIGTIKAGMGKMGLSNEAYLSCALPEAENEKANYASAGPYNSKLEARSQRGSGGRPKVQECGP